MLFNVLSFRSCLLPSIFITSTSCHTAVVLYFSLLAILLVVLVWHSASAWFSCRFTIDIGLIFFVCCCKIVIQLVNCYVCCNGWLEHLSSHRIRPGTETERYPLFAERWRELNILENNEWLYVQRRWEMIDGNEVTKSMDCLFGVQSYPTDCMYMCCRYCLTLL